ncbi:MAG: hypothetical protein ACOC1O_00955 [bacterium]
MNLKDLLKGKTKSGVSSTFETTFKKGKDEKVMVLITNKKKYVIDASIKNYTRFEKWDGKTATVDFKKTGKFIRTEDYGILPTVNINAKVKLKKQQSKDKDKDVTF